MVHSFFARFHASLLRRAAVWGLIGLGAIASGCGSGGSPAQAQIPEARNAPFALRANDRVVFYGDSITDQRQYTIMTEDFIVTRFPQQKITFIHSGWGGDRVTGGGGGDIDTRLNRDVTAYKPTVVTVMLGMNDGSYRAFDDGIFQTFAKGYEHLVSKLQTDNPGVRLTLIEPSPYDDVTRELSFPGGYNAVMQKYGVFVRDLAAKTPVAQSADLNAKTVAMLQKANETDAALAQKIIGDRVHPGAGGHLVMAQSLLMAWNAPAVVSSIGLDAQTAKPLFSENASVSQVSGDKNSLRWTARENSLPFPLNTDKNDTAYALALKSSDFVNTLDREMLTVKNLAPGNYSLTIDGEIAPVGTFSHDELSSGVNLATLATPMFKQAQAVSVLTRRHSDVHNRRWRDFQVPLANDKDASGGLKKALSGMDALEADLVKEQRAAAQPKPHSFVLAPVLETVR